MNLKRQTFIIGCTDLPKKEWPYMEIYRVNNQKRKKILIRKYHVTLARTKAVTYSSQNTVQLWFSKMNSLLSAESNLSGRTMAYNTSPTLDKQTMWTLASVKTDLDSFPGTKMIATPWILNWRCTREKLKMQNFDWNKTLQWEKLIPISLFDKKIN